jgi:hypothetical protein
MYRLIPLPPHAAAQAIAQLIEGLPPIIGELERWGKTHYSQMSPVAIRCLATQLKKLFTAVQAADQR